MNDEIGRKFVDWRWFLNQNFGPHVNREMKDALNEVESEIDRIEAQRDELLTALKMARTELGNMSISEGSASFDEVLESVDAAIAKAEAQP